MSETLRRLLFPIVAQFPALGAIWHKWELVKQRPILVATLTLLYEGGVAALAFGKEVWREEFEKDAIKATADWVRAIPGKIAPGFRKRYNQRLLIEEGTLNLRGLVTKSSYTLKLIHVFVDLKISTTSNPNQFSFDPVIARKLANTRSIWDFIRQSKDKSGDAVALAIIGPPGSGKSTLMQHTALTLAANRQRRHRLPAYIPILLRLRKHGTAIVINPEITLGELVTKHFSGKEYEDLRTPYWWFEKQLKAGRCLVMLDGLDEVVDSDGRRTVSAWADQQIKKYSRCRFVVTSRPRGYGDAPLERANVVEVQLLNADQIIQFINGWYLESETVSNGHVVDQGVKLRARREAEDLLKRLQNPKAQAINALTANPLLLTMIAMVHCFRGQLPGSRVELYREICEVLLGRWRQVTGILERMTTDQKRDVLMPMAAWMMDQGTTEIATDEALQIIQQPLSGAGIQGAEAKWFLSDLHDNSGLVLEREASSWSFAHKTFQEYLTATYWLPEKILPDWAALVKYDWWYETLRLYAMQGDATPILQACLNDGSVPALTLAAEIIEEGPRKIDQTVRAEVYRHVDGALEDSDPELRRLAAQVKLSQRLKSLHPLDHQKAVAIDLEYVTCAEYQLFIDEMRQQGRYHQPDHWINVVFPSGQGNAPICGVRAEDAEAFCDWLTRRQGGNTRYCLPTPEEAQAAQLTKETPFLATWCRDDQGFSLTMLAEATEQEFRQALLNFTAAKLPLPSPLCNINSVALDRDFFRDLDRVLDFDRTLDIARDRTRARARDSRLVRRLVLARNLNLDFDLARDRVRIRDLGIDTALDIAFEIDQTLARDLARDPDPALAFAIARVLTSNRDRDRARARDLARDLARSLNLTRDLARNRDLGIDLNRDSDSDHNIGRDIALALALDFNYDLDIVRVLDIVRALDLARDIDIPFDFECDSAIYLSWLALLANLLADKLALNNARTASNARRMQRQHVARLAEYLYLLMAESTAFPWWRSWWRVSRVVVSRDTDQQAMLETYWWLQIVMAREAGALPAWEGIRIVRKPTESMTGVAAE
jgi:energy-coupling factor transporter ATP-binding protein EcfA2